MCEEKTTHAKLGGIIESNIRRTIQDRLRSILDIRNRPRLCIRANETGTRKKQTLQLCDNRRKNKRVLPISQRILRSRRHTNDFPRENSKNIRTPNTSLAGRHHNRHPRSQRRTHPKTTFGTDKTEKRRLQREQEKKSKFYQKETIWLGHTISQDGIRPNKEKTDEISKVEPPTNTKTLKSFLGAIQYFAKLHTKLI